MMEIMDKKRYKKCVRLNISLYGKSNSIYICRDVIRVLGFPKYISLRIKDKKYIALLPSDVKEPMSFLVPQNLFSEKREQFRLTSKAFITSFFYNNNLDINKSYFISGDYLEKENVIFFNIANNKPIIRNKIY